MRKAERIRAKVVVVEHAPRPADDGIGMHVRLIVESEVRFELVANFGDGVEVIEAKRVGRTHRGDNGGDFLALFQGRSRCDSKRQGRISFSAVVGI